jgi:hypothetical protein
MDRHLADGEERSRRAKKQLLEVAGDFDWVTTARRFAVWLYRKRKKRKKGDGGFFSEMISEHSMGSVPLCSEKSETMGETMGDGHDF